MCHVVHCRAWFAAWYLVLKSHPKKSVPKCAKTVHRPGHVTSVEMVESIILNDCKVMKA